MVGVESDADQIAQTIIIPVPDKTIHLIRHGVLAIHAYIYIFIIIEKFHPGRGVGDRPLIRDNLHETIRPFALLRPEVLIQLTVDRRSHSRYFPDIIGTFIRFLKGDDRVLLGFAQQRDS